MYSSSIRVNNKSHNQSLVLPDIIHLPLPDFATHPVGSVSFTFLVSDTLGRTLSSWLSDVPQTPIVPHWVSPNSNKLVSHSKEVMIMSWIVQHTSATTCPQSSSMSSTECKSAPNPSPVSDGKSGGGHPEVALGASDSFPVIPSTSTGWFRFTSKPDWTGGLFVLQMASTSLQHMNRVGSGSHTGMVVLCWPV